MRACRYACTPHGADAPLPREDWLLVTFSAVCSFLEVAFTGDSADSQVDNSGAQPQGCGVAHVVEDVGHVLLVGLQSKVEAQNDGNGICIVG